MRHAHGFTLMEVLVALVLLTLFTLVSYRALDAVLTAQRHAGAELERWHGLSAAFARVASDLSNAISGFDRLAPVSGGFRSQMDSNGAMQFDLVRRLPEDADAGLARVGYRCSGGALSRLVWPDVNDPAVAPRAFTLVKGLSVCGFQYLDHDGKWLPLWVAVNRLPQALEIDIAEADASPIRRVWSLR